MMGDYGATASADQQRIAASGTSTSSSRTCSAAMSDHRAESGTADGARA